MADIVPVDRRGEAMGIASFFGTTGMAMGPTLGSEIYLVSDIDTLFYTAAGASIFSILILAGMKETLKDREHFKLSMLKISKKELYEPTVIPASITMLFVMVSFGALLTLSPDFSKHLGITNKGHFFTFYTGSSMLARIVGGKISDKIGRVAVLKISTLIIAVSMAFIGFAEDPTWLLPGH